MSTFICEIRKAVNGYLVLLDSYEHVAHSSRERVLVFESWDNLIAYLEENELTLTQKIK